MGNNAEGSGSGLIWAAIPACLEAMRKTTKTSFRITGLFLEIRKEYLNKNHKHCCFRYILDVTEYTRGWTFFPEREKAGNALAIGFDDSVGTVRSRRMRWAGHVARMGEERGCIGSWWGNWREGDHWVDLGVEGWIILWCIFRRWDVGIWNGLGCPRIETGGGSLWVR